MLNELMLQCDKDVDLYPFEGRMKLQKNLLAILL